MRIYPNNGVYKEKLAHYISLKQTYHNIFNKQHGGVWINDPLLIYIIGDEDTPIQRRYLCTLLFQLHFFNKQNYKNDRINIIVGNNVFDPNTCYSAKAGIMKDKPIPYGVDVNYVNNNIDLKKLINYILTSKCNPNTPVTVIFDGHGYENSGNMIVYNPTIVIDSKLLHSLFKDQRNLLFIMTQCEVFDFYHDLSLPAFYILSSKESKTCGFGAEILVKLSQIIENTPIDTFEDLANSFSGTNFYVGHKYTDNIHGMKTSIKTFFPNAIPKNLIVENIPKISLYPLLNKNVFIINVKKNSLLCFDKSHFRKRESIYHIEISKLDEKSNIEDVAAWKIEPIENGIFLIRTAIDNIEYGGNYGMGSGYINYFGDNEEFRSRTLALWSKCGIDCQWRIESLGNNQFAIINNFQVVKEKEDKYLSIHPDRENKFVFVNNISDSSKWMITPILPPFVH
jgi:hypothetical protein